jgi:hypothetical protein
LLKRLSAPALWRSFPLRPTSFTTAC